MFKAVTGAGDAVAKKMTTTFKTLAVFGDWSASGARPPENELETSEEQKPAGESSRSTVLSLRHDVHIHLPPTSDVAVYTAIFRALRDELLD
jgi:hypothetical protein